MNYLLQHCFTDKLQYDRLPVAAYSPSLGCKLHAEPTVSNMSSSVSSLFLKSVRSISNHVRTRTGKSTRAERTLKRRWAV